ncbi:MAG: DEAD/DEAH box helicase family protein [Anaerolineae bacterium]|nr:DEAD/DEAH box helicase family protein [Anaerolineae bacterium]
MTLKQLTFPITIDTSSADIIADFFVPALSASVRYDRGVGYFSAGWLKLTARGMVTFAGNGGHARWVTSPILAEDDWLALQQGTAARHDLALRTALERNIAELEKTLEKDTLSALAWMVADEILDFRLALPRNKLQGGEFHDKFGIFTDGDGQRVSFSGSYNESIQGTRNYESLRIFSSWDPAYSPIVHSEHERFERLWNNLDPNVQVYTLPDAARASILKLRSEPRPYLLSNRSILTLTVMEPRVPPELALRDYQLQAIEAWFTNGSRGILEMATGTGKTKTSLSAMARLYEQERRLALIISVPYQHLVDQWFEDAKAFGLQPILAYKRKADWLNKLHQQVLEYNRNDRKIISVITTHTTFIDSDFRNIISGLQGPCLLIADEVHHLGAARSRAALPENISARLGLSATPDRWYDEGGTLALRGYFGDTVFRLDLSDAIKRGILVPYIYYPQVVELTLDEMVEYQEISEQISKLTGILSTKHDENLEDRLEKLLFQRTRLLNSASEKITALKALISKTPNAQHTLFYCSPEQIDQVSHIVGWEYGWNINRFTAEEDNDERQRLLTEFDNCNIQALVAMKCLDEGVDVPSTRTAYILASSSNPREFIQRRGRVLRRAPNKEIATIYDFIVVPPQSWYIENSINSDKSIVEREFRRFKEFADSAQNKHQALSVVWDIAEQYGVHL